MSIIGVGTDIVEISRIKKAVSESFLHRYFTAAEAELFALRGMNPATIAANFAAKEAFVKAVGTGFGKIGAIDVEPLRDEAGRPYINAYGAARDALESLSVNGIHVSMSHCGEYAVAFLVLEGG